MKAIYWGSAIGIGFVVIAWLQRVKRITREGKAPMSPRWLNEHVYDRQGDRRWK